MPDDSQQEVDHQNKREQIDYPRYHSLENGWNERSDGHEPDQSTENNPHNHQDQYRVDEVVAAVPSYENGGCK